MTPHEIAFRHIANNDVQGRFLARTLSELLDICKAKRITDPLEIRQSVRAYFDQCAEESAIRLGMCRLCRARRPTHLHVEPIVKNGGLAQAVVGCTEPYCERPMHRQTPCCPDCAPHYHSRIMDSGKTRAKRLRERGASVPQWLPVRV